jgi:Tol biopolymer transport system component
MNSAGRVRWSETRRRLAVLGTVCLLMAGCTDTGSDPVAAAPTPADPPTSTSIPRNQGAALAYGVNGDIFVADPDGANAVRIADGVPVDGADECGRDEHRTENIVFGTAWSPDGRYLAYWDWGCPASPNAWGTVLITDPEGNLVASFPGQGWTISWSADSMRVAIWDSWGEGDTTIGVYGLDGVRLAALTVPSELMPSGDYSPVWSRDGTSLLVPGVQVPSTEAHHWDFRRTSHAFGSLRTRLTDPESPTSTGGRLSLPRPMVRTLGRWAPRLSSGTPHGRRVVIGSHSSTTTPSSGSGTSLPER